MSLQWTIIDQLGLDGRWRIQAPGGWLVTTCRERDLNEMRCLSDPIGTYPPMMFVSDPKHEWDGKYVSFSPDQYN